MTLKHIFIILVLQILIIPSTGFGDIGKPIKTGYDLYSRLSTMENPVNTEESIDTIFALGFVHGIIVTLHYANAILLISEMKIPDYKSYNIPFSRINFPEHLPIGQVSLIYLKWAKANPEKLNLPAHSCIIHSLRKFYENK